MDEKIELEFDEETGLETQESEISSAINSFQTVINQAENFKLLQASAGWKQIESFIKGHVENLILSLKLEENFDKIKRLQSQIVAFESVLNIIELSFSDAEKAKIELQKLIGPEN